MTQCQWQVDKGLAPRWHPIFSLFDPDLDVGVPDLIPHYIRSTGTYGTAWDMLARQIPVVAQLRGSTSACCSVDGDSRGMAGWLVSWAYARQMLGSLPDS